MPLRLISFDAVGTLIRVSEPVARTYASIGMHHGIQVGETALRESFADVWRTLPVPVHPDDRPSQDDDRSWWFALVSQVFESALGASLPSGVLKPLFDELYAHYAQPSAWEVYDDVLPALQDLSRNHRLCVLSNFDRRLRNILDGHGLSGFFEAVVVSSEVGASKPHPRMFAAACRLIGGDSRGCLHAGDEIAADVQGAEAVGWLAFAVSRPGSGLDALAGKVRSGAY